MNPPELPPLEHEPITLPNGTVLDAASIRAVLSEVSIRSNRRMRGTAFARERARKAGQTPKRKRTAAAAAKS